MEKELWTIYDDASAMLFTLQAQRGYYNNCKFHRIIKVCFSTLCIVQQDNLQHQNDCEREEWKLYYKVVFSEIADLLKMQTIARKKATG